MHIYSVRNSMKHRRVAVGVCRSGYYPPVLWKIRFFQRTGDRSSPLRFYRKTVKLRKQVDDEFCHSVIPLSGSTCGSYVFSVETSEGENFRASL